MMRSQSVTRRSTLTALAIGMLVTAVVGAAHADGSAKLRVALEPAAPPNARLLLDGTEVQGPELLVPPGHHTLAVTADGFLPTTQDFDASLGETKELSLKLVALAPPPTAPATEASAVPSAPTEPAPPPAPRSKVPAYITLGFAGAGAILGTTFGILALRAKRDYDAAPSSAGADKADRNALVADIGLAVAVACGAVGTVLLLGNAPPPEPKAPAASAALPRRAPAVRGFVTPYAGPTGGGAAAVFSF